MNSIMHINIMHPILFACEGYFVGFPRYVEENKNDDISSENQGSIRFLSNRWVRLFITDKFEKNVK